MLNMPITASVQPPISADNPRSIKIRRQMHCDERELEATGKEAEHQQNVTAVTECFGEGLPC